MPQLFPPITNKLTRYGLLAAVLGLLAFLWLVAFANKSNAVTGVGYKPEQPIQFSHVQHVNQVGLDCRYCHSNVEESSFANIPSTETCMTCHSQVKVGSPLLEPLAASWNDQERLAWNRVNQLPDYVYFNHSIHVNKGVSCVECHGRMDQVDVAQKEKSFHMAWCLECHRNPEAFIRPKEEVTNLAYQRPENQMELGAQLVKKYHINKGQLENCAVCHR